ncbi:MAG TPA: Dam family site-specific DNA-(adenine-N6)-methyltransferase [Phycisphaerae bacterium]|nr:Dam family site-specific DNA-(adenine-N6)-methyltransferase [Phycisphaerae bacterium]HPS53706.1 Dam family site-specific DNA-(adenine-N6)-methyltransferase [Phycisphaerae bacterium]
MKPFLKWAGGKYKIIDRIIRVLPQGTRLIEPFAGSSAVFLNTKYEKYLIADSNIDLINVYKQLKKDGTDFIAYCNELFIKANNKEKVFYRLREEFNTISDSTRKAALFIYLNRHCFNGLCRYNSRGLFNVPFGSYKNPPFPEKEMLDFVKKSKKAQFMAADFVETMGKAVVGDVIYCDPPYVPLTETSNFTNYTGSGFGQQEQDKLVALAKKLANKGIPVIISNHDTDFTRNSYSSAQIDFFDVRRFISSKVTQRNKVSELLAVFA